MGCWVPRKSLPDSLGPQFRVSAGLAAGATPGRLEGADLDRPFWGVRASADAPADITNLARAYLVRMTRRSFFSHQSAALLHGIPLPIALQDTLPLHVSVPSGDSPPEARDIRGHRLAIDPDDVIVRRGIPMTTLERTLCDLAAVLGDEDLLAAGDNILWRKRIRGHRATARSLEAAFGRFRGRRGRGRLRTLMPTMTDRADSPPESTMRLRFIRAGLPVMLVNAEIHSASGVFLAQPDLQIRRYKMAIDYEGDHHRTDAKQWRKDLARVPRLQDAGWHHTRISADDLADSTELINRLRRLLKERGWQG